MDMQTTEIIFCLDASQAFRLEKRSEYVLEPFELGPEAFKYLCGSATGAGFAAFEHEILNSLLHLDRRQVREGKEIFALIMRLFRHELLPPLIVDYLRYRIGKRASPGVTWCFRANRIALQHPAAAEL